MIFFSSPPQSFRATALGFYNWGIYIGYSLAFTFNFILLATNWRWAFRIAAFPGFVLSVVMLLTVREPQRKSDKENGVSWWGREGRGGEGGVRCVL